MQAAKRAHPEEERGERGNAQLRGRGKPRYFRRRPHDICKTRTKRPRHESPPSGFPTVGVTAVFTSELNPGELVSVGSFYACSSLMNMKNTLNVSSGQNGLQTIERKAPHTYCCRENIEKHTSQRQPVSSEPGTAVCILCEDAQIWSQRHVSNSTAENNALPKPCPDKPQHDDGISFSFVG